MTNNEQNKTLEFELPFDRSPYARGGLWDGYAEREFEYIRDAHGYNFWESEANDQQLERIELLEEALDRDGILHQYLTENFDDSLLIDGIASQYATFVSEELGIVLSRCNADAFVGINVKANVSDLFGLLSKRVAKQARELFQIHNVEEPNYRIWDNDKEYPIVGNRFDKEGRERERTNGNPQWSTLQVSILIQACLEEEKDYDFEGDFYGTLEGRFYDTVESSPLDYLEDSDINVENYIEWLERECELEMV